MRKILVLSTFVALALLVAWFSRLDEPMDERHTRAPSDSWVEASQGGYEIVPAPDNSAYLELHFAATRDELPGSESEIAFRFVSQRGVSYPELRRTPRGVRAVAPATLRPGDEVLAQGTLTREPIAAAALRSARGFVVLGEPLEWSASESRPVENPRFLVRYDRAGELVSTRGAGEVFSTEQIAMLSKGVGLGCGTLSPSELVTLAYRRAPVRLGVWDSGPLHVAAKELSSPWVLAAIDLESGERVEPYPPSLSRGALAEGSAVLRELALELLLDTRVTPSPGFDLLGFFQRRDLPLALRVRAADHLARRHSRAGRELLLEAAGHTDGDPALRYPAQHAAQALGRVLDRSEASLVVDLARRTPYDRNPFGQALLDMEVAGARALILALVEERDSDMRKFLEAWLPACIEVLRRLEPDADPELVRAIRRLATERRHVRVAKAAERFLE